ncbi:MAG: caspase family protein [Deltaproteobacteria bacterium]|nr:caspase family protein [Deltaproteobacteria bacterium]
MAKKALLIGINRYRIPGSDLRGCVNDVKNMRSVLMQYYGFASKDISVLTDLAATTKAIEAGIYKLVAGARAGDVLLLHYSGHGSNVPDKDGDEADHRDEILCPTDLDWKNPLEDDWLRKTFDRLRPGVSLTVIMDCCHSGTNTRALNPPDTPVVERFLPCPWDLVASESGRALRGKLRGTLRSSTRAKRKKKDVVNANIPEVLVSGCRDTQTSADARINGSFNGALTYYLVEAIKASGGALSYRELHQHGAALLKKNGFSQVPQLEGRSPNLDRPFLAPAV